MYWNSTRMSFVAGVVLLTFASGANGQDVLYVNSSAPPGGHGLSWESAFTDLQDALDVAQGDPSIEEIWVAGGTYYPDRGSGNRDAAFMLPREVGIFGGFLGHELQWTPRDQRPFETILSGDIGVPGFMEDNSKAIAIAELGLEKVLVENMTFKGAFGTWGALQIRAFNDGSSIIGCRFVDNEAVWGGGLFISDIINCSVTDCDFEANTANHGGALYLNNSPAIAEIANCRFYNNYARGFGGAVANTSSHPIFRNCSFINNTADREGGAISNSGGEAVLVNCILWNNPPNEIRDFKSSISATYSCITGGWPGEGNFSADPILIDPDNGDLRLAPNSPCIDAGDNDGVPPEQTLDLDFNVRFVEDLGTPNTGHGTAPIVDLGCYEFQGTSFAVLEPVPGEAGRINRFTAIGARPSATIWFVYGLQSGSTSVPGCPGITIGIDLPKVAGNATSNGDGFATLDRFVPQNARGRLVLFSAVNRHECLTTRVVTTTFE